MFAIPRCVHVSLLAQNKRVVPSGSDESQRLLGQVFDQLGRELICCATQAQLPVSTIPKRVEHAARG